MGEQKRLRERTGEADLELGIGFQDVEERGREAGKLFGLENKRSQSRRRNRVGAPWRGLACLSSSSACRRTSALADSDDWMRVRRLSRSMASAALAALAAEALVDGGVSRSGGGQRAVPAAGSREVVLDRGLRVVGEAATGRESARGGD